MYSTVGLENILRGERSLTIGLYGIWLSMLCLLLKKWRTFVTLYQSVLWSIKSLKVDENREEEHKNNCWETKCFSFWSFKLSVALRAISYMKIFCFMFRSYSWKEASRFGYFLPEGCVDFLLKLFKFRIEYW